MKGYMIRFLLSLTLALLAALPALSQTPPGNASQTPAATQRRPPENLPWTRFHPAAPPYKPTDAEKQQIQVKIEQLDGMIRELRSMKADDGLLADVEIYVEAARWKMAYPEEFFRPVSVADTLSGPGQGPGTSGAIEGRQIALDKPKGPGRSWFPFGTGRLGATGASHRSRRI